MINGVFSRFMLGNKLKKSVELQESFSTLA